MRGRILRMRYLDYLVAAYFPSNPFKRRTLWTYNVLVVLFLVDRIL